MKHNFRQIGAALLAIAMLAGAGYVIFKLSDSNNPYKAAAERIEAEFGEYVDVTYIGKERESKALVVVVVRKKVFDGQTDPMFATFEKMLTEEFRKLIVDEVELDLFVIHDNLNEGYVIGFDAQGLKNGKTLTEAVMASTPISGTPKQEYLVWMDK